MRSLWERIKEEIGSELPRNTHSLWIKPLVYVDAQDGDIVIGCPNKFSLNWVSENYLPLLNAKLSETSMGSGRFLLQVQARRVADEPPIPALPEPEQLPLPDLALPPDPMRGRFNRNFTFERFIVGRSNEFAYTTSHAMARDCGSPYQTLLLLAGTGLGKSHLSQAIGQSILADQPQTRLYYMTAEDFTNEMIFSLKNSRIDQFKNKFRRECDVLLLEEVQFLGGKDRIQLELGYTLDALLNDHKKVIFTSSLPPKNIPHLSKELSSRLTSGLISTIQAPDYQTRCRILQQKSAEHRLRLGDDIIAYLSENLGSDVRQMESALKCLKAKSELLQARIDRNLAQEVVASLVSPQETLTLEDIRDLVARYFRIDASLLVSKSRRKIHVYPRQIYIYLCRQHTQASLETIAKTVNRTHSAVVYASESVAQKMTRDEHVRYQVEFLNQEVEGMKH